jgi:hypothetical protein
VRTTKENRRSGSAREPRELAQTKKDFVCVIILLTLVFFVFHGIILKDAVFSTGGDTAAAQSWASAGDHIKDEEQIDPLWIPYVFSGMPGLGSLGYIPRDVSYVQAAIHAIGRILFLNAEMSWFVIHYFIAGLFMFMLARTWKFTHLPSLIAAVTFMLSPYAINLASGGHGSKMMALSYFPLLLLLTHNLLEKRNLLSLGLLSAAIGTQFLTNHVQMVYYGMALVGVYLLYAIAGELKTNLRIATKKVVLFALSVAIGFAISAYVYLPVNEYAQFSIRGGGEIGAAGGLSYDYATNWSFHPFETLNFLIPSFFGFETPYYWGWMPFTDTTVYFGIVPILLGILALVYRRNRQTLFFALFSGLVLLVSFGKHFPLFYDLLFNYLPYFNKFRAPSMILHLMPLTFGMLAAFGYTALIEVFERMKDTEIAKLRKRLTVAVAMIGGILVIGFIANTTLFNSLSGSLFEKETDLQQFQQQYGGQAPQVLAQLKRMRFDLLWKDYVKFAFIASASIGIVVLYLRRKLKPTTLGVGLVTILIIDLLIIDTKFIEPKPRTDYDRVFAADATVRFLKSDTSLYRIFPLGGLFMDNTWMYHTVQSIGGYSPAKIKIYQEMIDSTFYRGADPTFPLNMNVVDMLNVKYLLAQGQLPGDRFTVVHYDQTKNVVTHLNKSQMPRAWFVQNVRVATNKAETYALLNSPQFDPRTVAILDKNPTSSISAPDSTSVQLAEFLSHRIVLNTYNSSPALLVLSEVYYPAGWRAYVDGNETEILRTNSILRSVVVPEGGHTIEFVFDPPSVRQGIAITHVAWGISLVLVIAGLWAHPAVRRRIIGRKTPNSTP